MDLDPHSVMAMSGLALYVAIFLLPFIQEDVAVVAAATASLSGAAPAAALFLVILAALTYVTIMFTLFHTVGEIWGEKAKFILPAIAVALLVSYVTFRWLTHRKGQHGPMTPLTEERDRPLYGMPGFEGTPLEGERREGTR